MGSIRDFVEAVEKNLSLRVPLQGRELDVEGPLIVFMMGGFITFLLHVAALLASCGPAILMNGWEVKTIWIRQITNPP